MREHVCAVGDMVIIRDCRCRSRAGAHNGYTGQVKQLAVQWAEPFYVVDHRRSAAPIPMCWTRRVDVLPVGNEPS